MKVAVVVAALVLAACGGGESTAPGVPDGPSASVSAANSWLARADYPSSLYDAASASITNPSTGRTTLYVIGGQTKFWGDASIIANVRAFDVSANTWTAKTSAPQRITGSNGAVAISGNIYISGGFARRWDEANSKYQTETLRSLYMYNPATDRWTRKRDMPVTSAQGVSAVYQNLLYVATDCYDTSLCGEPYGGGALWRYTPSSNTWVLLSRTPHAPFAGGGGFVDGKLYLVNELGDTDIFDVTSKTWSSGPTRPTRLCAPAGATLAAKLYLVGCYDDFDGSGVYPMLVFDPKVGSWSRAAAPPVAADGHRWTLSRVVVNGQPRLELIGGTKPGNNWQYVP